MNRHRGALETTVLTLLAGLAVIGMGMTQEPTGARAGKVGIGGGGTPVPSPTMEQLLNPIMYIRDTPDGICGGGSQIASITYPARRSGVPTYFDATFNASTGGSGGSIILDTADGPSAGVYLPANSATQPYTLTLAFPYGVNNAPMFILTAGDGCGSAVGKTIQLSELAITVR